MRNNFVFRRSLLGVVGLAAMLSACGAPLIATQSSDEELLLDRAKAYWGMMQKNDTLSAWKFEAASKDQSMTMDTYFKRGGIIYDAVEVRRVRMLSSDEAEAEVWMRYTLPLVRIKNQEVTVQDHWRRIDGAWYHQQRQSVLFGQPK